MTNDILIHTCPCCGGKIEFDPQTQRPKCPYCDTEFDIEDLKHYDEDLDGDTEDSLESDKDPDSWQDEDAEGFIVYICSTCGGEIIAEQTASAMKCPYCDNPVIIKGQLSGDLKPDLVIPFKLGKEEAKAGYLKHISKKPLLPKVFKEQNHIDEIKGIYVPFWLYDADADGNARFRATKVRSYISGDYNCVETSYFSVVRNGTLSFKNIPVDGSTKMADDLMESIEPFDYTETVDFKTAYLSGYLADRYDISLEDSRNRAATRIKQSTEDALRKTVIGYTSVIKEHSSVSSTNGKTQYVLYPVWMLNTTWKEQKFTFAMNGQTGKFVGNLPVDKGAFVRWLFGGTAVFGVLSYLVLNLIKLIGG